MIDYERRWREKTFEIRTPKRFRGREVLPFQPHDVIAIRAYRRRLIVNTSSQGVVVCKDFLEQQRDGPAVQQEMMMRPHKPVRVVVESHQLQTHQGSNGRIES